MGRGPKATISLMYCMERAESKAGGGLGSAGTEAGDGAGETDDCFGSAGGLFSRAHANSDNEKIKPAIARNIREDLPAKSACLCRPPLIIPFAPGAPSAASDEPATQFQC